MVAGLSFVKALGSIECVGWAVSDVAAQFGTRQREKATVYRRKFMAICVERERVERACSLSGSGSKTEGLRRGVLYSIW